MGSTSLERPPVEDRAMDNALSSYRDSPQFGPTLKSLRRIRNWLAMAHGGAVRVTEASTSDATDAEVHGSYEEP
jgi:hypothetical protein